MAGVIPVIFAASIMAFPPTIGQLDARERRGSRTSSTRAAGPTSSARRCSSCSSRTSTPRSRSTPWTRRTTSRSTAGSSRASGRGAPTAEFLDRILARLTFPGALYLAAVAALPTILINQTSANFYFGGTWILIVIGVALDTMKQLEAQLMMRNYEGFLK